MSQLDGFFADAARIGETVRAAKAQADDAEIAHRQLLNAHRAIQEIEAANSGNLAMKHLALRELGKVDPTHPLVRDASLREAVSAGAKKVMRISSNWDDVRDYGLNYKLPGR